MTTTPKCKHRDSMGGRCEDCGMTWEQQKQEREDRLSELAYLDWLLPQEADDE